MEMKILYFLIFFKKIKIVLYSGTRLNEEKKVCAPDGFAPCKDEYENNQFSVYFVTKSTIEILTYI
jgi:hypothetical protein